jgi:hypothetical protein
VRPKQRVAHARRRLWHRAEQTVEP